MRLIGCHFERVAMGTDDVTKPLPPARPKPRLRRSTGSPMNALDEAMFLVAMATPLLFFYGFLHTTDLSALFFILFIIITIIMHFQLMRLRPLRFLLASLLLPLMKPFNVPSNVITSRTFNFNHPMAQHLEASSPDCHRSVGNDSNLFSPVTL